MISSEPGLVHVIAERPTEVLEIDEAHFSSIVSSAPTPSKNLTPDSDLSTGTAVWEKGNRSRPGPEERNKVEHKSE